MESDDLKSYHERPWVDDMPQLVPFDDFLASDHAAWIYTPVKAHLPVTQPTSRQDSASGVVRPEESAAAHGPTRYPIFSWRSSQDKPRQTREDNPDRLADGVPRFIGLQDYVFAKHQRAGQPRPPGTYLTGYEVESDKPFTIRELQRNAQLSNSAAPDADLAHYPTWMFALIGSETTDSVNVDSADSDKARFPGENLK